MPPTLLVERASEFVPLKQTERMGVVFFEAESDLCIQLFWLQVLDLLCAEYQIPSWRNWLARSTVNREVGGSSPPEGVLFCI